MRLASQATRFDLSTTLFPTRPDLTLTSRLFWPTLIALSAGVLLVQLPGPHATAWHFFELAADLLVGGGPVGDGTGLHLYRDHPEFQFGPLSIVAALPFTLLGETLGEWVVLPAASIAGLVVVSLLIDTLELLAPGRLAARPGVALVAGATIVVTWGDVAVRTAHIDDALALLAVAAAVRWVAMDRATAATVALAVAAAAKPWAVVFVALAAVPSGGRRWSRPVVAAAAAVLTWAPFILVEPATLDTRDFEIANDPTSVLRALGVEAAATPGWVRWAQLLGGLTIVTLLVVGRRWTGGLLAGIAWRLLLDPAANRYYTIGFVVGALLIELRARPGRTPWFTIGGAVILEMTAVPDGPVGLGQALRMACILAAFVAVALNAPDEDHAPAAR